MLPISALNTRQLIGTPLNLNGTNVFLLVTNPTQTGAMTGFPMGTPISIAPISITTQGQPNNPSLMGEQFITPQQTTSTVGGGATAAVGAAGFTISPNTTATTTPPTTAVNMGAYPMPPSPPPLFNPHITATRHSPIQAYNLASQNGIPVLGMPQLNGTFTTVTNVANIAANTAANNGLPMFNIVPNQQSGAVTRRIDGRDNSELRTDSNSSVDSSVNSSVNTAINSALDTFALNPVKIETNELPPMIVDRPPIAMPTANVTATATVNVAQQRAQRTILPRTLTSASQRIKPFECNVCHKRYSSKSTLKTHFRLHTDEASVCDICGKSFPSVARLEAHQRRHRNERPFECHVCQHRFADKCNLQRHIRIHSGEKPYKCDFCEKRFTDSTAMVDHRRRMHTLEKPYSCPQCKKSFVSSSDLKSHSIVHSTARPFGCTLCGIRFKRKQDCKSHLMTIHNLQPNPSLIAHFPTQN